MTLIDEHGQGDETRRRDIPELEGLREELPPLAPDLEPPHDTTRVVLGLEIQLLLHESSSHLPTGRKLANDTKHKRTKIIHFDELVSFFLTLLHIFKCAQESGPADDARQNRTSPATPSHAPLPYPLFSRYDI